MKSLQIDEKEALKHYESASPELKAVFEATFGKAFFSKKITDKIRNWEDVLRLTSTTEDQYYINITHPLSVQALGSLLAYIKLLKITELYNEGWTPNWDNSSEYKYYNYFYKDAGRWSVDCYVWLDCADGPVGLFFKSRELAEDAMKKFRYLYEQYFMIG